MMNDFSQGPPGGGGRGVFRGGPPRGGPPMRGGPRGGPPMRGRGMMRGGPPGKHSAEFLFRNTT